MNRDLIYPNTNDGHTEDRAVVLARRALYSARGRDEMGEKQVHRKRCLECNELFHREELYDGYCLICAPLSHIKHPVPQVAVIPSGKECFRCDWKLFFILGGGRVRCARCGSEYDLTSPVVEGE